MTNTENTGQGSLRKGRGLFIRFYSLRVIVYMFLERNNFFSVAFMGLEKA